MPEVEMPAAITKLKGCELDFRFWFFFLSHSKVTFIHTKEFVICNSSLLHLENLEI